MSDIRQTLNQVLAGSAPPKEFLKAVDEYLAQPAPRVDALKSLIDAAEHLGLPAEIAAAARARIPAGDVTPIGEPTRVTDGESTEVLSPDATRADIGEPTRVTGDDDGDSERTQLTSGAAPTVLRADPADVDRTEISGDPDRTVATGDGDRTVVTGDVQRIAAGDDPDRTEVTGGDDDRTIEAGGGDPFAMVGGPAGNEPGPGSVLKGRFRLEEVIGQGGMGAVYKAVDLLKVEARDRNPYMAVKLLVGDFKEHPEAFIALQRESAKAQRLAHPNIATVYDFDRDGETVYMTMELMVGAELAKYIKKLPAGGLPVTEANKIIEQLCSGLQYAHARGLVHSDFKPGNAFLLDDGTVKLLDFGIARASKTKGDAEGESTVFDPGQLGALTPAYATIEMFEGQDPDPRDDIYALACVAYELYTGKHPFNKMSAVKAKEKNLKVAPVAKLNKRQNRTLLKALALHRDDRLGSVEEFWEGLKPRKDYTLQIAGGSIAAILLIGFLAYGPILNAIHEREHTAIIEEIDSGDEARLVAALGQIDALPDDRRRTVAERAQERIVAYFSARADAAANRAEERYDYPAALAEVDALGRYFPNSGDVLLLRQEFEGERTTLVNELRARFEELLEAGAVMPVDGEDDITDVLAILKVAQPDIELLNDIRLIGQYVARADAEVSRQRWQEADRIVGIGLQFAPRNPELLDRRDRVAAELQREAEATMVAALRDQLRGAQPRTLADFRAIREPLEQLGSLRPADPVVRAFDARLRRALDGGLAELAAAGDWAAADALLAEFARTLEIDALVEMRTALSDQQLAAGYDVRGDAERNAAIALRAAGIRTLLADAAFDDEFERALTAQFKDLTARADVQNGEWTAVRDEIAGAYIAHARELAADNRYAVARTTLDAGQQFHPALDTFAAERQTLAAAETEYLAEIERRERLAALDARKQQLRGYISAGQAQQAVNEFNRLRRDLPADDPFIRDEAPTALAGLYARLATEAGENNNPQAAAQMAEAGLQVLPGHPELTELQVRYRRVAAQAAARNAAGSVTQQNFAAFQRAYADARQGLTGAEANQFDTSIVNALANRLTELDRAGDFSGANALRRSALQVFPNNQRLTQLQLRQPSQFTGRIRTEMDAGRLTRAREILVEGQAAERDHPDLQSIGRQLAEREAEANALYRTALAEQTRDRAGAQRALEQARGIWNDNPQFEEMHRQFVGTTGAQRADDGSRACTANLAGLGARGARAACFDMVAGERGPQLVVINGVNGGAPIAVSKYEVSVGEYNHFCRNGGGCQPVAGDDAHPVTGITIQNADAYIAWLVETTGKQYRLPTDAEWVHAAGAGGDGKSPDNNCRVVQGGNVIKGLAVTRVTAGPSNAWGLANVVGNAQEWTRNGSTLLARGGSFEDPLSNCEVGLVKPHGGGADQMTGFRVMRGID